jgi:ATP-dependent Lon protease
MFKSIEITPMAQQDSEELVQLINPEQESDLKPEDLPEELSILPIKNTVLFPGVVIPITVESDLKPEDLPERTRHERARA